MVQYSAYYYKNNPGIIRSLVHDSAHCLKMSRVIFCVWFSIQRIILKWLGYYLESGSVFSMLTCLRFRRTQVKLMFMLHILSILAIAIIHELPSYIGIGIVTGICISEKYCCKIYSDNSSVNVHPYVFISIA